MVEEPHVIHRTAGVVVTLVLMSFMALVGVVGLVVGDGPDRLVAGGFVALGVLVGARALLLEVRVEDEGLYVRRLLGTRTYPWGELRGADVLPGSLIGRTWYLRVLREGARPMRFPDLSQGAWRRPVEELPISRMARLIDRRVRMAGGRPPE